MRLIWIVTALAAVLVVLFVVSNTAPVALGLWPFDARIVLPLSVAVLAVAAIAFLLRGDRVVRLPAVPHARAPARPVGRGAAGGGRHAEGQAGAGRGATPRARARLPLHRARGALNRHPLAGRPMWCIGAA
jgi:hypothetical protein